MKIASIYPGGPEGSWHVEGMINDGIDHTFIFYKLNNIKEHKLKFAISIDETEIEYAQDQFQSLIPHYGFTQENIKEREFPNRLPIGDVTIKDGLLLAFPNPFIMSIPECPP